MVFHVQSVDPRDLNTEHGKAVVAATKTSNTVASTAHTSGGWKESTHDPIIPNR